MAVVIQSKLILPNNFIAIDSVGDNGLLLIIKKGGKHDSRILYEMQSQEGNEKSQEHYNEEQKARY
jgi:hypothetical protein